MRIYTLFYRKPDGSGQATSFTNLKALCEFAPKDVNYNTLVYHFTRRKKTWYEDPYKSVTVIRSNDLIKGQQRVIRKDKGHNRNI